MLFSYLLGMKTKLIFFSHKGDSFLGLQRGITAFVTLVLLDMIWFRYADYSKIITKKLTVKIKKSRLKTPIWKSEPKAPNFAVACASSEPRASDPRVWAFALGPGVPAQLQGPFTAFQKIIKE